MEDKDKNSSCWMGIFGFSSAKWETKANMRRAK